MIGLQCKSDGKTLGHRPVLIVAAVGFSFSIVIWDCAADEALALILGVLH